MILFLVINYSVPARRERKLIMHLGLKKKKKISMGLDGIMAAVYHMAKKDIEKCSGGKNWVALLMKPLSSLCCV